MRKLAYRKLYWSPMRLWRLFKLIQNKASLLPFPALPFALCAHAH